MTKEEFQNKKWKPGQTVYYLSDKIEVSRVTEIHSIETKKRKWVNYLFIEIPNSKPCTSYCIADNNWCERLFTNEKDAKKALTSIKNCLKNGL